MTDDEWLALLRSVDRDVEPFPAPPDTPYPSWVPPGFDRDAMQGRFDRLAERLGEEYGVALAAATGPAEDAYHFGVVPIPADVTCTRVKRSRVRCTVFVLVSNFGGLATLTARPVEPIDAEPPVSAGDRDRIEPIVTGLGYLLVPGHILDVPYDGPRDEPHPPAPPDDTWYRRYFGYGLI